MTEKEMFSFHGKNAKVVCTDRAEISGMCWCYSAIEAREDEDLPEAYIDVDTGGIVFLSEIQSISEI